MEAKVDEINSSRSEHKSNSILTLLKDINCLVMFITAFIMTMGVQLINPVIPEIISYFKISEVRAGLVISLFTFPTIIISPIVGSLSSRFGYKIFLFLGVIALGIPGILPSIFKISFNSLLIIRTIQGMGFAIAMPFTIAALGDFNTGNREVSSQGVRNFFISVAGFLFPVIGGALAVIAWNYPFACYWAALPIAYIILRYLPSDKKFSKKKELNLTDFTHKFIELKNPYINIGIYSSSVRFFITDGTRFFIPIYLVYRFSSNLALVGAVLGFTSMVKALIALFTGKIVGFLGFKRSFIFCFTLLSLSCLFMPLVSSIHLLSILMFLTGVADAVLAPLQKSYITQNATGSNRGFFISILSSVQNLGRTVSPIILAFIMEKFGIYWSFMFMAIIAAIPVIHCFIRINSEDK